MADENRRDFQSKKHVSLDIKHTRFLENILKASSSSDEDEPVNFEEQRRQFQGRKHKSLDPKVTFKLDKDKNKEGGVASDDEFVRPERRSIIRAKRHDSNSIIVDLKDFQYILQEAQEEVDEEVDEDDEENEDLVETRTNFQAQKSMSTDSRRSYRFFEMDDLSRGGKKGDNIRNSVPFVRQITEDGKPMLEIYRPTTNPIYIYTQVSCTQWRAHAVR